MWCYHCKIKITTPNECCPLCYNPFDGFRCDRCGEWARDIDYCYPCSVRNDIESERAQSIAESKAADRAERELAQELAREDEMLSSLIEVAGSRRFPG